MNMEPVAPARRWRKRTVAVCVVVLLACAAFAVPAQAATYMVGTPNDLGGACRLGPASGTCSLRQLINFENGLASNHTPADTIIVPANSYFLSNPNADASLTIEQNLNIVGAGARTTEIFQNQVAPAPTSRVFYIAPLPSSNGFLPTVTISGLDIVNGHADDSNGDYGGDIRNEGTLTLSEDKIEGGHAGSGAGVGNVGGQLTITHTLITGNHADFGGADSGGIQNFGPNPTTGKPGTVSIDNSTIANNTASLGGGIFTWCQGGSTSNPCATSGNATPTTTVTNSTIVGNDGGTRADVSNAGGVDAGSGSITLRNTIVALNTLDTPTAGSASNCAHGSGTLGSLGHNLESGTDCGFKSAGDLQKTNPKFFTGVLADNGGNTNTLALDASSPAVDEIPAGSAGCSGTDQRDVTRPQGSGCDIGAYELLQPAEGSSFTGVLGAIEPAASVGPSIDWGDGTAQSPGSFDRTTGQVTATHTYATAAIYNGVIHYTTSDHRPAATPFQLKVVDVPFSATGTAISATKDVPFSGQVATISDSNPLGSPSNFSASINWGDGTNSPATVALSAGKLSVSGTHTYSNIGTYPTTISINDVGGSHAAAQGTATVTSPPDAATSKPSITSSNAATFSGLVNPEGSFTTAHWDYGLDSSDRGPGFNGTVFDQSTPSTVVGSDLTTHNISTSVSNLQPNALYHVRLVATNGAGTSFGPEQTFVTPKAPAPPPPVLGKSENFTPSGTVFVLLHGQFVKLTQSLQLPTGTVVNAARGSVTLVSASGGTGKASDAKAKRGKRIKTFTGTFGGAVFRVTQAKAGRDKGLTTLSLLEGITGAPSLAACKAKRAGDQAHTALSSRILQTLRSRASGRYRTRGRYAAGTVRGTKWTTTDRCDGTLIAVQQHSVLVTDLIRHITILVRAGHQYLARAPKHK